MKQTLKLLGLLCTVMTLMGCPDDTAADYVTVSTRNVTFPYNGGNQKITISSNTEWKITYTPSWVEVSVKSANGSTETTLSTARKNSSVAPVSDVITIAAGTASDTIHITQNPPVSPECKTTAVSDMQLVMSYGYSTDLMHGSAIGSYRYHICTEAEYSQLKQSLDNDVKSAAQGWESHKTDERTIVYDKCQPGQSYHLFTVGYSSSNDVGGYQDFPFSTPRVPTTPPTVNISLNTDIQQTASGETVWQWDAAKKSSCKEYLVYACASPEKFHSYKLAEAETDTKRRGLWLAHQIMAKRKMSATTEKSGPTEPNSTLNINFGLDNDRRCHEILYELLPNDTEGMTLHATPEDHYLEVFTWCVSNTDGQLTSIVSDSIYTIDNGHIVGTGTPPIPPADPHTTATPTALSFGAGADAVGKDITVTSNEEWTVTGASWLTVTPSSGSNNGTVKVTVTENTKTAQRTAIITITGKTSRDRKEVTVTQAGKTPDPHTTATPTTLSFGADADAKGQDITVTSNEGWTATSDASSWCIVSPSSGSNNGTVKVTVTANSSTSQRTAHVTIKGNNSNDKTTVTVTQEGAAIFNGPFIYYVGPTNSWGPAEQKLARSDSDGIYTGFIYMAPPNGYTNEFKFQKIANNWDSQLNSNSFKTISGDFEKGGDHIKAVAGEGVYYIELDLKNKALMGTLVKVMGIIGSLTAWSNDIKMTWNPSDYCFEAKGVKMNSGDEWKFRINNDWSVNLGGTPNNLIANGSNLQKIGNVVKLYPTRRNSDNIYCTVETEATEENVVTITVSGISFKMIRVEAGTFTMGATSEQGSDADHDEKPAHSVTLTNDYYMGETEVTQALWQAVMGQKPTSSGSQWSTTYGLGGQYPAYYVSWNDCQEFITKLNQLTGRTFRLPTEAEWEYAARGGKKSKGYKYAGSNTIGDVAWYTVNSNDKGSSSPDYGTHAVATKQANELGLYDMSGNVYEWCSDWYGSYSSNAQTNPSGPTTGSSRVIRGGSWNYYARYCRVSNRGTWNPDGRSYDLGLRLAL